MPNALGRHILVEFFGCSATILNDVICIEKAMVSAAKKANATVINSTFHHFSPYGVSGVVVIQESHLAIHAWPEYQYAAVDIFTCGNEVQPWVAYDFLKEALEACHGSSMEINRGQIELLKRISVEYLKESRTTTAKTVNPQFKRDVWFTDKDENIALSLRHTGKILYNKQSDYQKVRVFESYAFGKTLAIDDMVMVTEKDEFIYHEMIVHIPVFIHGNPKRVLVIGGGDGGTIRELFRHSSIEKVVMVEIDEYVVEASKLHLPQLSCEFDNPNLELHIMDGVQYMKDCDDEEFDLIVIDGSDPEGPAEGLFSYSFYKDAYRVLKPGGILNLQSEGPLFNTNAFLGLNKCMHDIFGKNSIACYLTYISTYPTGMWSFITAQKNKDLKYTDFDLPAAAIFSQKNNLQYYTPEMHFAAYALPPFVRQLIKEHLEN
ncbi:MAG: polyamine aminopropyltransferase [Saprospiraceae bacterium]|nr:polyamine aminopropyltransferase [Saprospiraceae bacterium]